jgi:hypothetical protein
MKQQKAALPKDPQHVVKKTDKLAETQQQENASLGGTESVKQQGGRIGSELRTLQALLRPVSFSLSMLDHHS